MSRNSYNDRRAVRARKALAAFAKANGGSDTPETDLIDLLADLRHYCRKTGLDFDNCSRIAGNHFACETIDPELNRKKETNHAGSAEEKKD